MSRSGLGPRLGPVAMALVAAVAGCADPAMSREEARAFTRRALAGAGLGGVDVAPDVRLEGCGQPARESWRTTSRVAGGGTVELCVPLRGDRAVYVRDVGPGGAGPLLTEAQFARLEEFRHDPVASRRRGEVLQAGALAAALVALAVLALVRVRASRRLGTDSRA